MIRFSFEHLLGERIEMVLAANGRDALNIIISTEIDVVLMDVRMPEMDGVEACARIKEYDRKIPVLIFSAFTDHKTRERARLAGADAFMPKPVDMQLVAIRILAAVKHSKLASLHHVELTNLSNRLNKLKERRALTGIDTPIEVLIEIENIQQEIEDIKDGQTNDKIT